jgi:Cys-rich protein (TIGR01571 family)
MLHLLWAGDRWLRLGHAGAFFGGCGCYEIVADPGSRIQIRQREEMRERYGIRGSAVNDCCVAAWCRPCALVQERREIELEERSFQ